MKVFFGKQRSPSFLISTIILFVGLLSEGDEFKDFRLKVSELIKDVVFIVGSSSCFKQMFINLQSEGVTWDQTEAALFVMQAVAKNVVP